MQVNVEDLSDLEKKLTIIVPVDRVKAVYQQHLHTHEKKASLPGFRPGKAPLKVIEQHYAKDLKAAVANELLDKAFKDAVELQQLKLAATLDVIPGDLNKNAPFEFTVKVEVFPEINLQPLTGATIDKIVINITDEDIDNTIKNIQKKYADWKEIDHPAEKTDRVEIDFEGSIDGELFENGAAEGFSLELDAGKMIPGFSEGIVGMKVGETAEVKAQFPDDYNTPILAGKEAVFKITLKKVEAAILPEVDDELAKLVRVDEGLDKLRENIREDLEKHAKEILQSKLKTQLFEKLLERHPFNVPNALVAQEHQYLERADKKRYGDQAQIMTPDAYKKEALKRVAMGLLLSEVVKEHGIELDPAKVRQKVENLAASYHKPEDIVSWYYSDDKNLTEVNLAVLEDQTVDVLLGQVDVTEKPVSYDEALKMGE